MPPKLLRGKDMKIRNIAQCKLMHLYEGDSVAILAGEEKEIPDKIAELWLKTGKVVKVDDGKQNAEIARLKAENEKLKAEAKANEVKAEKPAAPKSKAKSKK